MARRDLMGPKPEGKRRKAAPAPKRRARWLGPVSTARAPKRMLPTAVGPGPDPELVELLDGAHDLGEAGRRLAVARPDLPEARAAGSAGPIHHRAECPLVGEPGTPREAIARPTQRGRRRNQLRRRLLTWSRPNSPPPSGAAGARALLYAPAARCMAAPALSWAMVRRDGSSSNVGTDAGATQWPPLCCSAA